MTILDNIKQIKKIDKSNMARFITDLPEQCMKAYDLSKKIKLGKKYENINNIVACGMGGSGIGASISKSITSKYLKIPFIVNQNYNLPKFVNKQTLVILISYSGNTLETLSCAKQAIKQKAKILIITSNGKLKQLGKKHNLLVFDFQYKSPPRAGLSYTLMPILGILENLNLINPKKIKINSCLKQLKTFNTLLCVKTILDKNIAKYLAYFIFDYVPIIIANDNLKPVAKRWKNQIAENSKTFCFFETQPELYHNFIESYLPERFKHDVVFLIFENTKNKKQKQMFTKLLDKQNLQWKTVPYFSNNYFTQILSLTMIGDWISFYLAILNNTDPTPVKNIEWAKKQMQ